MLLVHRRGIDMVLISSVKDGESVRRYPDRGLHGQVVAALGSEIVSGRMRPGDTIDLELLAERYGVSRTVIRECLRVLGGKGLIDARPKRGTYVQERSSWNLLDPDVLRWEFEAIDDPRQLASFNELRRIVEPGAAELAAMRRTDEDIAGLRRSLELMEASESRPDAVADADLEFHLGLIRSTHNDLVAQLSTAIGICLAARDRYVHRHGISIERALGRHRAVLDQIEAQNPGSARAAMLELLEAAASDLDEFGAG